jgi:predicted transcriptional regulator
VNIVLAVFNLLPGFPLDGGRVLRSAVWKATGSLSRATRVASISGQAMGYLLIAGGAFMVFRGALGGLWLAAIGWFLAQAARASYQELQVRGWLESVEADEIMAGDLMAIPDDLTLQEAVDRFFMRYDHGAFPVEAGGRTVGLITLRGIKRVSREEWDIRRVRDVMGEIGDQTTVGPDTRMDHVLGKLQDGEANRVLVVSDDEVVGIITPSDVARWLQRRRALEA